MGYRFRTEGELLVLQVCEPAKYDPYYSHQRGGDWRDATVKDIPINDPFNRVEYVPVDRPPGPVID